MCLCRCFCILRHKILFIDLNNGFLWVKICVREERLRFWSDPDTELKLAKDAGVTVFRMGVDWTRIMPKEPTGELKDSVSPIAHPFLIEHAKYMHGGVSYIRSLRNPLVEVIILVFFHNTNDKTHITGCS